MKMARKYLVILALLGAGMMLMQSADRLHADDAAAQQRLAGVPLPEVARGKGDSCIAPTDFMRRNHMDLLKHDRDAAVHLGDREIKASLQACISCHAVNGADNKPVTVADPKHFCRSCHDYAAVKVDCFECHASRPGEAATSMTMAPDVSALAAYLSEAEQ